MEAGSEADPAIGPQFVFTSFSVSFTSSLDGMCGAVQALIRNAALCSTHKDARIDNNSEIDDIIRSHRENPLPTFE